MASKFHMLRSKVSEASKRLSEHGSAYYKQMLEKNKKYIQNPPTVEKCRDLSNQLFYTRLASIPSRYEAFWNELDHVKQLVKNRQLRTEDVGVAALFGIECLAWFHAGKIIGRGSFIGYPVDICNKE